MGGRVIKREWERERALSHTSARVCAENKGTCMLVRAHV